MLDAGTILAHIKLDDQVSGKMAQIGNNVSSSMGKIGAQAQRSLNTIGGLNDRMARLNKVFEGAKIGSQRFEAIRKEMERVNRELDKAKGKMDSLGKGGGAGGLLAAGFAGGLVGGGVTEIIGKVVGLGKAAVMTAAQMESAAVSFKVFMGGGEAGARGAEKLLTQLNEFANVTPYTNSQVIQAGKSLMAFGVSAGNVEKTLRMVGDVSAATGKDFNELATIYGKAKVAGTLFAEDINQLTEAGVPVIQEFAKQLGVSTDQVKKMASEGQISFKNLEQAFADMTGEGGQFFDMMSQQSETVGGKLSTVQGKFEMLLAKIGGKGAGATSAALDVAAGSIDAMSISLDEMTDSSDALQNNIAQIAGWFTTTNEKNKDTLSVVQMIGVAMSALPLPMLVDMSLKFWEYLTRAIASLEKTAVFQEARSNIKLLAQGFQNISDILSGWVTKLGVSLGLMEKVSSESQKIRGIGGGGSGRGAGASADYGDGGQDGGAAGSALSLVKPTEFVQEFFDSINDLKELADTGAAIDIKMKTLWEKGKEEELINALAGNDDKIREVIKKQIDISVSAQEATAATLKTDISGQTKAIGGMIREGSQLSMLDIGASLKDLEPAQVKQFLENVQAMLANPEQFGVSPVVEAKVAVGDAEEKVAKDQFDSIFSYAGSKLAQFLNAGEEVSKAFGKFFEDAFNAAVQQMNNLAEIAANRTQDMVNKLTFFGEFQLMAYNKQKEAEVEAFSAAEDAKIAILRESVNAQMAILDEEFAAIKSQLERELAERVKQLEKDKQAQLDYIHEKSADKEQEQVLDEITEEDFRVRKEELEAEHMDRVAEAEAEINRKREKEKRRYDGEIQKAEKAKADGLNAIERARAEEEKNIKRSVAMMQYMHTLGAFKANQNLQVANNKIQTALGVMNAWTSAMALPFPFSLIVGAANSALIMGMGSMTEQMIRSTPAPMPPVELFFAKGGLVPGDSNKGDVVPARLSPGEFVMSREMVANFNEGPQGVVIESGAIVVNGNMDEAMVERLADAITERQGRVIHRSF